MCRWPGCRVASPPPPKQGWVCPKCGRVWAPTWFGPCTCTRPVAFKRHGYPTGSLLGQVWRG
jgi:hypothetical protein